MELGCDPSLFDASGRVPYMVASDKETRATFRRFMGVYPNRFDYVKAAIPSPLTDEIEKQKAEKLAEKRKLQKQAKKEKKAVEKAKLEEEKRMQEELLKIQEEKRKIEEEKARFLALSDREKVTFHLLITYCKFYSACLFRGRWLPKDACWRMSPLPDWQLQF